MAFDSSPLEGAGRGEDPLNVLGHAARKVGMGVAMLLGCTAEAVARQAGIPVLLAPRGKAGLDVDWSDPQAPTEALQQLVVHLAALEAWIQRRLPAALTRGALPEHGATLHQVQVQDLEPQPASAGVRVREGVAPERRCSIEAPEMRHGRKSKPQRFTGYTRHVATDLDADLIVACAVTPANHPEAEAAAPLTADIAHQGGGPIAEWYIDRGYLSSPIGSPILKAAGIGFG